MRALVLSDIHANLEGFEAVLAAAAEQGYEEVWNLGDVVGYGASPNEVIDRLRPLGQTHVRGNHDRVCCGLSSVATFNPIASRAALWTQARLTEEHLAWLRALAQGPVMPDGPMVSCVHGSPLHEDEYVVGLREAREPLLQSPTCLTFFGHTHVQGCFAGDGKKWFEPKLKFRGKDKAEAAELKIEAGTRYLINPGSVGQPRDHDWRAAFAIYDDAARTVVFHRVPYDLRTCQQRILEAGLPERLASRLKEGR
ncbi:MAG: metallophosphoesterase family protein [Acidobacteriaceae bacterium]